MKVIDCKNKQKEMIEIAKNDTDKIFAETGKKLKLVVFQVEGDDASNVYIRNKKKACEQCGIECEHIKLPTNVAVTELKEKIKSANNNNSVTGIMVQLPLPEHLKKYEQEIIDLYKGKNEIEILSEYLPKQLSREEVKVEVEKIISEIGATSMKDMGAIMKEAKAKLGASAEGKTINEVAKEIMGL